MKFIPNEKHLLIYILYQKIPLSDLLQWLSKTNCF